MEALDLFHEKMNFLGSKLAKHLLTRGEICFPRDLGACETYFSVSLGDQSLGLSASTPLWQGLLLRLARELKEAIRVLI